MIHHLKILPRFFEDIVSNHKRFEIRYDDRMYRVGDVLVLHEMRNEAMTGRKIHVQVQYIHRNDESNAYLEGGYCVLGFTVSAVAKG